MRGRFFQTWMFLALGMAAVPGPRDALAQGVVASVPPPPGAVREHVAWSGGPPCPLCELPAGIRILRLAAADVDSLGNAYAAHNEKRLAAVDSLYHAGRLGEPGSGDARRAAHLMARLATLNAYSYVAAFATDSTCVHEADEGTLARAFASFSDPGLYPITQLRRARMGFGRVCLRYDLAQDLDTLVTMGARRVRVRVREMEIEGRRRRMLSMMLPTGLDDLVEVLVAEHYACAVEHLVDAEAPAPCETYLLHEMRGLWLRKWGTHRPRALMFWVTPPDAAPAMLPESPLVGVRLYVPRLVLRLPFLPDVGFDDLREIDLPQPILRLAYLRRGNHPEWLEPGHGAGFEGWSGHGPVPARLRERFPDR
jgi:hypothetical protein